jgi:hypothetical protein
LSSLFPLSSTQSPCHFYLVRFVLLPANTFNTLTIISSPLSLFCSFIFSYFPLYHLLSCMLLFVFSIFFFLLSFINGAKITMHIFVFLCIVA